MTQLFEKDLNLPEVGAPYIIYLLTYLITGASKGSPGDAKYVTEILEGGETKKRKLGGILPLFQGKINALNYVPKPPEDVAI